MTHIFVNIATSDLDRSKAFYTALGFGINPQFSDDNAACIVIDDNIFFMVLTREHFSSFTDKQPVDPHTHAQVLIALSRESREAVDEIVAVGLAHGGSEPTEAQDYGFMYSRDLDDPDGNGIEFMWMDPQAAAEGPAAYTEQAAV